MLPFEVEAKEKNLLIGKLRHEAVILNDHLTRTLKKVKRGKPEDTIDRYVSHHLDRLADTESSGKSSPTTFSTSSN